jgi:spermidine synthase
VTRAIAFAIFALTTFVSAFLLFQVQPLLSKRLLPWFGGSPAVWTTCVLFFQSVLFAGYAYAHASEHWLPRRMQTAFHLLLLAVAFALLPILPGEHAKPVDSSRPVADILAILGSSVGLAYFLLSTTGPLVSAWCSRTLPHRSPYRLYALSNFGSLLALLTYPIVFEPAFSIVEQADYWAWGFRLFAVLAAASGLLAVFAGRAWPETSDDPPAVGGALATGAPHAWQRAAWIALAAFASLAFLATTNFVCQDIAVVPFLWVAPLSLYLISFIICFDHERWYRRRLFAGAFLTLAALGPLLYAVELPYEYVFELLLYFSAMFCVCMICHGELVRLRPPPRHLTAFYLSIAAGGAAGGILVSVVAPAVFSTYYEWPLAAIGGAILSVALIMSDGMRRWFYERRRIVFLVGAVALLVTFAAARDIVLGSQTLVWQARNFYGVVTVTESSEEGQEPYRLLRHGRITHGMQFIASEKRRLPTSYYTRQSGIGQLLSLFEARPDLRVGDVGLGTGTLATYARPGQTFRFYEINPQVIELAYKHFTYLADCLGKVEIIEGDGRLSLEREAPNEFDVMVLDAFSGDAIPTHLLTTEAFDIYERHLVSDGAMCIHVSNLYLDLTGIVYRLAAEHGFDVVLVEQREKSDWKTSGVYGSDWMVLSKSRDLVARIKKHVVKPPAEINAPLWTDAHTDLFRILK